MTMPPVPTMNAFRWSRGESERQASAMTTALSPERTMLITAILNSATHVAGSVRTWNIVSALPESIEEYPRVPGADYPRLSPQLRFAFAILSPAFRQHYGNLTIRSVTRGT